MHAARIITGTIVLGTLCWWLGKVLFTGLKSGKMPHTDSVKTCSREENPAGFWALALLFLSMLAASLGAWIFMAADIIRELD